jgi:hypothetical protein
MKAKKPTEEELKKLFVAWMEADKRVEEAQRDVDQAKKNIVYAESVLRDCLKAESAAWGKVEAIREGADHE